MSGSIRLFVQQPLAAGATFDADPPQAHYLGNVMRLAAGDTLVLFNGRDGEFQSRIETLHREHLRLRVQYLLRPQSPDPDLWLAFAMLKRNATDLLVEKATELGVSALLPVLTERTIVHRVNLGRLTAIAIEAAEQCERLTIPELHAPQRLAEMLASWPSQRPLFVAMERSAAPPIRPALGPAALLVGPEGGFTPGELDALSAHPFVTGVTLGPRILRAETACIAGLALLQAPANG